MNQPNTKTTEVLQRKDYLSTLPFELECMITHRLDNTATANLRATCSHFARNLDGQIFEHASFRICIDADLLDDLKAIVKCSGDKIRSMKFANKVLLDTYVVPSKQRRQRFGQRDDQWTADGVYVDGARACPIMLDLPRVEKMMTPSSEKFAEFAGQLQGLPMLQSVGAYREYYEAAYEDSDDGSYKTLKGLLNVRKTQLNDRAPGLPVASEDFFDNAEPKFIWPAASFLCATPDMYKDHGGVFPHLRELELWIDGWSAPDQSWTAGFSGAKLSDFALSCKQLTSLKIRTSQCLWGGSQGDLDCFMYGLGRDPRTRVRRVNVLQGLEALEVSGVGGKDGEIRWYVQELKRCNPTMRAFVVCSNGRVWTL